MEQSSETIILRPKNFTTMNNHHLFNKKLTNKAKGLLSIVLALPPTWEYSLNGLASLSKDGRDSIMAQLNELKEQGYFYSESKRNSTGRFHTTYYFANTPEDLIAKLSGSENQNPFGNTESENPNRQEPPLLNTNISNTKNNIIGNKLSISRKHFSPPSVEEVEAYCLEKGYSVDAQHFVDFYESKGWVVGKSPMKDWHAAIRTWIRNEKVYQPSTTTQYARSTNSKFTDPRDIAAAVHRGIAAGMARAGQ